MNYIHRINSPLGPLTAASDGNNLTGLWMEGQKYYAATLDADTVEQDLLIFEQVHVWLDCYFSGKEPAFTPALQPSGSEFRQSVWDILRTVPYGSLITYGQIAAQLETQSGKKVSAQAVGGAVGHNPISILIPCHRVVGTNGSLTGYAGGIEKKIWLLELEKAPIKRLFRPSV